MIIITLAKKIIVRLMLLVLLVMWFLGMLCVAMIAPNGDWTKMVQLLIKISMDTQDVLEEKGNYHE